MKPSIHRPCSLLLFCLPAIVFFSCQKEPDEQDLPANPTNYIKKENKYYTIDAVTAIYDSVAPDRTIFSLSLHNVEAEQRFVVFDFLLLPKTDELVPGTYAYQKVHSSGDMEVGKFHDVVLKCDSPVMSGVVYPVSAGTLSIAKTGRTFRIDGNLVMNGKSYKVRFSGPVDHLKAW